MLAQLKEKKGRYNRFFIRCLWLLWPSMVGCEIPVISWLQWSIRATHGTPRRRRCCRGLFIYCIYYLRLFLVEWIRLREGEEEECVRNAVHSRIVASVVAQKGSSTQKEKCRESSLRWSKVRSIETKLKFQFDCSSRAFFISAKKNPPQLSAKITRGKKCDSVNNTIRSSEGRVVLLLPHHIQRCK